jgi:uncharacterized membrane protein
VRAIDGTITPFHPSLSTSTSPRCIVGKGWIVGWFFREKLGTHGFIRTAHGRIRKFNFNGYQIHPYGINGEGAITGDYYRKRIHGFVRDPDGTFVSFDPAGSVSTEAYSINSKGEVAGSYVDATDGALRGYKRIVDGTITTIEPPGSVFTKALSINANGAIAGYYEDSAFATHAFVRLPDGTIEPFDVPGSIETVASSVNDRGMITGYWVDSGNYIHGFVRTP